MAIRSIAGLAALSIASAAQAGTAVTVNTAALTLMLLLAAIGSGLVVFALFERQREQASGKEPLRLRQSARRYNQP